MSNSGAFKLVENENTALKKSLIDTQNDLEKYRSQYYESDKMNVVYESMKNTIVFHEALKYIGSGMLGGYGINLISENKFLYGGLIVLIGLVIYIYIIKLDNRIFNKKKES
jgi:hypothetical protein